MNAKEYLESKGVFGLDTKKRYHEVIGWMEGYAQEIVKNRSIPAVSGSFLSREWLMDVIDEVVDTNQTLGSANIADGIIERWEENEPKESEVTVCELCGTSMMITEDGHLKCMNLNCNGFKFTY